MPVTKPSKLEQETSKKIRETIEQRRTTSRWAFLRVASNTVFENYLYSEIYNIKVRFMEHISCYNTEKMQCCIHF